MYALIKHIFAKPKDPVMKEQWTDTIYSIPCNDCDNEYIVQTKRQFGTWLKEHQKAFFSLQKGKFSFIRAYMPNQTTHSLNLQTRVASNYVWLSTWLPCEL